MRYADIAVAALVGISAIAGILTWHPGEGDRDAENLRIEAQLRDELLSDVQLRGMLWFATSSLPVICAYLHEISNASLGFSAQVGSYTCYAKPSHGFVTASLALNLVQRQVVLTAWTKGPA